MNGTKICDVTDNPSDSAEAAWKEAGPISFQWPHASEAGGFAGFVKLSNVRQWVKGTRSEDWRNRHADEIADLLMTHAAKLLSERFLQYQEGREPQSGQTALVCSAAD